MIFVRMEMIRSLILCGLILTTTSCSKSLKQDLLYSRAQSLHDQGKYDKAIAVYKKILELEGEHDDVIYDLGVAYADKGDEENARNQVETLRKVGRSDLADILEEAIRNSLARRSAKKQ